MKEDAAFYKTIFLDSGSEISNSCIYEQGSNDPFSIENEKRILLYQNLTAMKKSFLVIANGNKITKQDVRLSLLQAEILFHEASGCEEADIGTLTFHAKKTIHNYYNLINDQTGCRNCKERIGWAFAKGILKVEDGNIVRGFNNEEEGVKEEE